MGLRRLILMGLGGDPGVTGVAPIFAPRPARAVLFFIPGYDVLQRTMTYYDVL